MSGLNGQHSVADAAPGDANFNGGRWTVKMVVYTPQGVTTFDPDMDGNVNFELMDADQVLQHEASGDLEVFDTTTYFECPMLPRRGNH
jgi:hypothetical protein